MARPRRCRAAGAPSRGRSRPWRLSPLSATRRFPARCRAGGFSRWQGNSASPGSEQRLSWNGARQNRFDDQLPTVAARQLGRALRTWHGTPVPGRSPRIRRTSRCRRHGSPHCRMDKRGGRRWWLPPWARSMRRRARSPSLSACRDRVPVPSGLYRIGHASRYVQ